MCHTGVRTQLNQSAINNAANTRTRHCLWPALICSFEARRHQNIPGQGGGLKGVGESGQGGTRQAAGERMGTRHRQPGRSEECRHSDNTETRPETRVCPPDSSPEIIMPLTHHLAPPSLLVSEYSNCIIPPPSPTAHTHRLGSDQTKQETFTPHNTSGRLLPFGRDLIFKVPVVCVALLQTKMTKLIDTFSYRPKI